MPTRKIINKPLNVLLAVNCTVLALAVVVLALTIHYKYLGFGLQTNPISCSSSNIYLTAKYGNNLYLNAIDITQLIAIVGCLTSLVILIDLKSKYVMNDQPETQVFEPWNFAVFVALFILFAIVSMMMVVTTGWFASFMREVKTQCGMSMSFVWVLNFIFGLLEIIGSLFCIGVLFYVRQSFWE